MEKNKTLSDVFDALFYLLYQKDVISEREYEYLSESLPDEGGNPNELVEMLLSVAGGRRVFELESFTPPCDNYI